MDSRTVKVTKEFYAQLLEYLQPEERFMSPINLPPSGLVLHIAYINRKLIFAPIEKEEETIKTSSPNT